MNGQKRITNLKRRKTLKKSKRRGGMGFETAENEIFPSMELDMLKRQIKLLEEENKKLKKFEEENKKLKNENKKLKTISEIQV